MNAQDRGWWRRLDAKHIAPWGAGELEEWVNARRLEREQRRIGPVPPGQPAVPLRAEWPWWDRADDPALTEGWMPEVPRVVDGFHH